MRDRTLQLRDRSVAVLARLSLVVVLAAMGALFVGGAAQTTAYATESATTSAGVVDQPTDAEGVLDRAHPLGLVLGVLVIGGGLGVLLVGAFRPDRRASHHEIAELLRR